MGFIAEKGGSVWGSLQPVWGSLQRPSHRFQRWRGFAEVQKHLKAFKSISKAFEGGGASLLTQPHPSRQRKKGLPFLVNNGAEEVTGGNLHQPLQRFDYSSYFKASGERAVLICWSHYAGRGRAGNIE
jgi:hypothetical protein